MRSVTQMREEMKELKRQNQKMYALFATSLAFKKRIQRLESNLLEESKE